MPLRIEDHALIGGCETTTLAGRKLVGLMPPHSDRAELVRLVVGEHGRVAVRSLRRGRHGAAHLAPSSLHHALCEAAEAVKPRPV